MEPRSPAKPSSRQHVGLVLSFDQDDEPKHQASKPSESISACAFVPANEARGLSRRSRGQFFSTRRLNQQTHSICRIPVVRNVEIQDHRRPAAISSLFETKYGSPMCSSIRSGGLRGDPFNAFPVESKDILPEALDFCKSAFLPCPSAPKFTLWNQCSSTSPQPPCQG